VTVVGARDEVAFDEPSANADGELNMPNESTTEINPTAFTAFLIIVSPVAGSKHSRPYSVSVRQRLAPFINELV
jgi:hypothetical protein